MYNTHGILQSSRAQLNNNNNSFKTTGLPRPASVSSRSEQSSSLERRRKRRGTTTKTGTGTTFETYGPAEQRRERVRVNGHRTANDNDNDRDRNNLRFKNSSTVMNCLFSSALTTTTKNGTKGQIRKRTKNVLTRAAGKQFKRHEFEIERQIGEGSFGIVYQAIWRGKERVVLKRPKLNVEGAAELQEIENWMNDRVSRDAKGACAEFLGSFRVTYDEWRQTMDKNQSSQVQDLTTKEGLWLVWKYQGDRTLAQFMAQSDYPAGLAKSLLKRNGVKRGDASCELEIAQKVMKQLLTNLSNMHSAGLVHRDIKPHNLVLADCKVDDSKKENFIESTGTYISEGLKSTFSFQRNKNKDADGNVKYEKKVREYVVLQEPEFKLIDLGACACFRTGTNFAPDETIMDPKYAPPEEFLIPTEDAPDLRKLLGPLAYAAGSAAWVKYLPDRFDSYSAGIVLMQLALPSLRTNRGLASFNRGLKKCDYDLDLWRMENKGQLGRSKTALLDAGDEAGWKLAAELLKGRPYWLEEQREAKQNKANAGGGSFWNRNSSSADEDDDGENMMNKNDSDTDRPSALECLKYDFFTVDPAELDVDERETSGIAISLGASFDKSRAILADMFGLQKRIERQQTSIKRQLGTVQRLKLQGASVDQIQKEEAVLEKMQAGLQGLFRSLQFKDNQVRTEIVTAASSFKKQAKNQNIDTPKSFDNSISKLKTREGFEKDFSKFAQNLGESARKAQAQVLKILNSSRDEEDAEEEEKEGDFAENDNKKEEEDLKASDDFFTNINNIAKNRSGGVFSSFAAATTSNSNNNKVNNNGQQQQQQQRTNKNNKVNETVVVKPNNSIAKFGKLDFPGAAISDPSKIRANMDAIEREMNSVMRELAKLDTRLAIEERSSNTIVSATTTTTQQQRRQRSSNENEDAEEEGEGEEYDFDESLDEDDISSIRRMR